MVKLIFNPKNEQNSVEAKSKTSKRVIQNLNPFYLNEPIELFNETQQECRLRSSELLGLENCHFVLKQWFYEKKGMLLIIGPTGCGKTTLINVFCREENIKLLNIKLNDKSKREVSKDIDIFLDYRTDSFFKISQISEKTTKKLILIDEYQNGQNDSLSISDIIALYEKNKNLNILIISSDPKGSKLSDLKKISQVYYINEIPRCFIKTWITTLNKNLDVTQVDFIVKNCKSDKRLILNILNFLKNSGNDFNLNNFLESYYKDIDINIFDFIKELFDEESLFDLNNIFKIYDNDGFTIANLIHENYLDYHDDIDSIAKASDSISYGEILFSDTYESNKFFSPDLHCLNSIIIPGFYVKSKFIKCFPRSSIINNRFNILLNNKKIMTKINANFKNNFDKFDIFDIYIIKKILNQELIKGKIKPFELKIEFVKNILKKFNTNGIDNGIERLELIYKHFNDFKEVTGKEVKTKNFTLKFKEKLKTT